MSFIAKLLLDDSEITIISANIRISQPTDITGRPKVNPNGGYITIRIPASNRNDLNDWIIDSTATKMGYIRFYKRDGYSKLVDWQFADYFCVSYHEIFSSDGTVPMHLAEISN